jgi:putative transport protein
MDIRGMSNPNIAAGYAMAYPLGVVGIILSLMAFKWIFRMTLDKEEEKVNATKKQQDEIEHIDIRLTNPQVDGVRISELGQYCNVHFIVSRLVHPNGTDMVADGNSVLHSGDMIRVVVDKRYKKNIMLLGEQTKLDDQLEAPRSLISRHIVVTKPELNGKRIGDLHVRETYRVSITRIRRAGVDLLATHDLILQLGDRLTVVGEESVMPKVEKMLGNSAKKLDAPNLISLFFGIVLGIGLGSIPFSLPGLSQPFKLGLAGGTLIVAILLSYF